MQRDPADVSKRGSIAEKNNGLFMQQQVKHLNQSKPKFCFIRALKQVPIYDFADHITSAAFHAYIIGGGFNYLLRLME